MRFSINILILGLLIISCSPKTASELKVKYKYIESSRDINLVYPDKRNGNVILVFTGLYQNDTIKINYNETDSTVRLQTYEITGLAQIINLGEFKGKKKINLKLNRFNPINIKPDKNNQIFLIEYSDKRMKIESVYHIPGFI